MDELLTIGNTLVLVRNSELLSGSLSGLKRLHHHGARIGNTNRTVTIEVEKRPDRNWELDVTTRGDLHCFGRPTYAFEVEPLDSRVCIVLAALPQGNDLYWFQRDLFGILACVSGGLMLHASAVVASDGGAWVFCGESGAGKSTICRMLVSEGLQPINDEVNWLLDDEGDGLKIVNQPFWFDDADAPLLAVKGLYLLRQGDRCTLKPPLPKSETFARLLAGHLSIDTQYDFMKERANALKGLVERYPIDVLEFSLDANDLMSLL